MKKLRNSHTLCFWGLESKFLKRCSWILWSSYNIRTLLFSVTLWRWGQQENTFGDFVTLMRKRFSFETYAKVQNKFNSWSTHTAPFFWLFQKHISREQDWKLKKLSVSQVAPWITKWKSDALLLAKFNYRLTNAYSLQDHSKRKTLQAYETASNFKEPKTTTGIAPSPMLQKNCLSKP